MANIYGSDNDDILVGTDEDDSILSQGGVDTVTGGAGNDTLTGNAGVDTFIVSPETIDNADTITDFTVGTDKIDLSAVFSGTFDDLLILTTDTADGIRIALDPLSIFALAGATEPLTATQQAALDTNAAVPGSTKLILLGVSKTDLSAADFLGLSVAASAGNDMMAGTINADTMAGLDDDDNLVGGDGDDSLDGGAGNDSLYGGDGGDVLTGGDGSDHVQGDAGNDTLNGDGGNDWMLGGDGDDILNGGDGRDRMFGHDGDDTLDGGASNDTMTGGLGDDTYVVDNGGDVIVENADEGTDTVTSSISYTLGPALENLTLTGDGDINGTGNDGANVLTGNSGANTLSAGAGNDALYGNEADDVLNAGEGGDHVQGDAGDDTLNGEGGNDWMLGGDGHDTLNGGDGRDRLFGNDGNDILDGGASNDTMTGGLGDDSYVIDNGSDVIVENADEGTDSVESAITYTLGDNLENLSLSGSADIDGLGNGNDNTIIGNSGTNILTGNGGSDTLRGKDGNDTLNGGAVFDALYGGNGNDILNAGDGGDHVQGDTGDDTLNGQGGNDWMLGGDGTDTINGGDGVDRMFGNDGNDHMNGGAGADLERRLARPRLFHRRHPLAKAGCIEYPVAERVFGDVTTEFFDGISHLTGQAAARRHPVQDDDAARAAIAQQFQRRPRCPKIDRRRLYRNYDQVGGLYCRFGIQVGMRRRVDHDKIVVARQALCLATGAPAAGGSEFKPGTVFAECPLPRFEPLPQAALRVHVDKGDRFALHRRPGDGEVHGNSRFTRTALLLRDRYNLACHGSSLSILSIQCCTAKFEHIPFTTPTNPPPPRISPTAGPASVIEFPLLRRSGPASPHPA